MFLLLFLMMLIISPLSIPEGGLLGNDLLRRFNLIINYEKRDIHMIPNSHFRDEFDYSYTGIGMYFIDGVIKIIDVMKGSPGRKSRIKNR